MAYEPTISNPRKHCKVGLGVLVFRQVTHLGPKGVTMPVTKRSGRNTARELATETRLRLKYEGQRNSLVLALWQIKDSFESLARAKEGLSADEFDIFLGLSNALEPIGPSVQKWTCAGSPVYIPSVGKAWQAYKSHVPGL